MEKEIWKDIQGYEGLYQVSNLGGVKNIKYGRLKKILINSNGYYIASLYKNNKLKQKRVHQLIAIAFIPNPNNYKEINHKNGIKLDNRIENLEWVSRLENVNHAYRTGLITRKQIEKATNSMKEKIQKPILQLKNGIVLNEFKGTNDAGRILNIHPTLIYKNLKRKIKHTHGFTFEYKEKGN